MGTGFCSECQSNVYLDVDGNCVNGHPATFVSAVSEVAGASDSAVPAVPEAAPIVVETEGTTSLHKRRWPVFAILFISGVILGALIPSTSRLVFNSERVGPPASQGEKERLKEQVASLTRERNSLKAELDPFKRAAAAATVAAEKVAAAAAVAGKAPSSGGMGAPSPSTGSAKVALPANTFAPGVYRVGTDIPAGLYLGTPVQGAYPVPYWKISSLANGGDIVENGRPTAQFYVQVKKGQYLTLDSVVIALIK